MGVEAGSKNIQIELNHKLQKGINPIVENGTTLVPLRSIGNLLGANVHWDGPTKTIKITQANVTNTLTLNNKIAYKEDKDGKTQIQLALPAQVKKGTTYVPLRYIAESLDVKVNWNQGANKITMNECLNYNNKKIFLGDSTEEIITLLGKPSFTMNDEAREYLFYVDDYNNVLVLYNANKSIVGFTTNAETMKFRDFTYKGQKKVSVSGLTIVGDNYDGDKIVGMGWNMDSTSTPTKASLLANERIIFELTNGFRAHNDIEPLKLNNTLSDIARKHSKDMAEQDYFAHASLDGTTMGERIEKGGISWSRCRENIAAGNRAGLLTFGQWVNSFGHRTNMLESIGDFGVGSAYNEKSHWGYYHTQNFATIR